ncbi:JmjC domain-containing histone demethylation protein 1 [Neolecta irregularis DAH-3]|uniref:JmjC domain-containing histone demethylation protein 1 n=1 Tax=Neolecta irregularis (strain DAH-3) TaxID=1198029 RepID=A0A1U7LNG9_NEOID|nr:JmjC domain-containing histone demethylation protein 1 [Neolecta irregularis DAH-3]|eukprot:OLL24071.1 JmjC domain-containing histone demethylation protein 1 [Neolecta irregularis DAH-3]
MPPSPPSPPDPTGAPAADPLDVCAVCADSLAAQRFVWIGCSVCGQWYHAACVGIEDCAQVAQYHCPACEPLHGPSELHRRSARAPPKVDYESLNQGTPVVGNRHLHVRHFGARVYAPKRFCRLHGHQLHAWARDSYDEPVVIPREWKDSLDMTMPEHLTVAQVAHAVGDDAPVEVIGCLPSMARADIADVSSQREDKNWTLGRWRDYFNTPVGKRDKIRNVISLEISQSPLAKVITRPKFVRDMDLVDKVWPSRLLKIGDYPHVKLYCLMSVQDCYTDFHVDFAGSSVFYHIINGAKTFLFIPPTELKKYTSWCNDPDQNKSFFADQVKETYRIDLTAGDTMIIPTGWIHAVYTPKDSLVIGGNFLCHNLSGQINVTKIERETKVPRKFRFPGFERVCWYACHWIVRQAIEDGITFADLDKLTTSGESFHGYRRLDLEALACYLHELVLIARGQVKGFKKTDIRDIKASEACSAEELVERLCILLWNKQPVWWKGSGKRQWATGWKMKLGEVEAKDTSSTVVPENKPAENLPIAWTKTSTLHIVHPSLDDEVAEIEQVTSTSASVKIPAKSPQSPSLDAKVRLAESPTRLSKRKIDEPPDGPDNELMHNYPKRKTTENGNVKTQSTVSTIQTTTDDNRCGSSVNFAEISTFPPQKPSSKTRLNRHQPHTNPIGVTKT